VRSMKTRMVGLCFATACASGQRDASPDNSPWIATDGAAESAGAETLDIDPLDEEGSATGLLLDVGPGPEDPDSTSDGCTALEFLFVVDNSGSMGDEQQNLVASFPQFIATIEQTVAIDDYRILVVETGVQEFYEELLECEEDCADPDEEDCSVPGMGDVACNALPAIPQCELTLGAGRVESAALPPSSCGVEGDGRYLTPSQPDLSATFQCMALVGTDGDGSEQPIRAMLDAVGPVATGGACNDGFLRDDAVLVVTLITDEEEELASAVESWRTELVAAKGGNESAVVMLGLISDSHLAEGVCTPTDPMLGSGGAEPSPRLWSFVESFGDRGVLGSVCEPDYAPFFQRAIDVIDFACEEYVPEG
jgi:hypothetical protein